MLVSEVGKIVNIIDVIPDPLFWEVLDWLKRLSLEAGLGDIWG